MNTLDELRNQIDKIDADIIKMITLRQSVVRKIGEYKTKAGKAIFDPIREQELMHYYENLCIQYQLPIDFIKKLFALIIDNSRKVQNVVDD